MNRTTLYLITALTLGGCASAQVSKPTAPVPIQSEYKVLAEFKIKGCRVYNDETIIVFQEAKIPVSYLEGLLKDLDEQGNPRDLPFKRVRDITGQLTGNPELDANGCPKPDVEEAIRRYRLRSF